MVGFDLNALPVVPGGESPARGGAHAAERIMDGVAGAQVAGLLQRVVDTVKNAPVVLAGVLEGFGYEQVLPGVAEAAVPFLWAHARSILLTARLPNLPRFVLKNSRTTPVGS